MIRLMISACIVISLAFAADERVKWSLIAVDETVNVKLPFLFYYS